MVLYVLQRGHDHGKGASVPPQSPGPKDQPQSTRVTPDVPVVQAGRDCQITIIAGYFFKIKDREYLKLTLIHWT